jgi:hypothetical protein
VTGQSPAEYARTARAPEREPDSHRT